MRIEHASRQTALRRQEVQQRRRSSGGNLFFDGPRQRQECFSDGGRVGEGDKLDVIRVLAESQPSFESISTASEIDGLAVAREVFGGEDAECVIGAGHAIDVDDDRFALFRPGEFLRDDVGEAVGYEQFRRAVDVIVEFFASVDAHMQEIPESFDLTTGKIHCRHKKIYRINIRSKGAEIRTD